MTDSIETTKMERLNGNIRKVRRNWTWTIQMFLSVPVLCAFIEAFPLSNFNAMATFAFAVPCFSLVISMIMSAMHYIWFLKKFVGGTPFELVMAMILLGLWIAAAVVIEDPRNDIASSIRPTGVEWIKQANLYFFTWFALFCNVYLFGSFFRDYKTYDLRVVGWISVLAASLMLLTVSSYLKDGICDADNGVICFRTKYAMVSSVIVSCIALIASVLSYMSKMSPRLGLVLASPSAAIYSFGVVMLTSASGPGRTLGTIYFTIWTGTTISMLLLIGEFNDIFLDAEHTDETDSKMETKVQMGCNDHPTIIAEESNPGFVDVKIRK